MNTQANKAATDKVKDSTITTDGFDENFYAALERKDRNFLKQCALENRKLNKKTLENSWKFISNIIHKMDKVSAWMVCQIAENNPALPISLSGDNAMMLLARHATSDFILLHREEVMLLASKPESTYLTNDEGETALMIAVEEGKDSLVRILLDTGSDLNHTSVLGQSIIDKIRKTANPLKTLENVIDWITSNNQFSSFIQKELRDMFYEALLAADQQLISKLRPFADDLRQEVALSIQDGRHDVFAKLLTLGIECSEEDMVAWKEMARKHKNGRVLGRLALMAHHTKNL